MKKTLTLIGLSVVCLIPLVAGIIVLVRGRDIGSDARQGSSTPTRTTTTRGSSLGRPETMEFCTTSDEPSLPTSRDSWSWNPLGDCLEMDR